MFWNLPSLNDTEYRASIWSSEMKDIDGLVPDMYHVILYEVDKLSDGPPEKTMDIVCKLLDPITYIKTLVTTMSDIVGTIFCKTNKSLQYHEEFLNEVKEITNSTYGIQQ